jgi:SSS family solute:Na+ symporter
MHRMDDRHLLWLMRGVVVYFAILVTVFALYSNATIYEMVENAYKVTLVVAFTPLAFGVYWKRANTQGAVLAILLGLLTWIPLEIWNPEGFWPPQFAGLLMSILGMVVGSLMPKVWLAHRHSTP